MPDSYILSRHPRTQSKDGADICRRCTMYRLETVLWPCPAAQEVEDMADEIKRLRDTLNATTNDNDGEPMNITETMQLHTPSYANGGTFCAGCLTATGPYVTWPCPPLLGLRIGRDYEAGRLAIDLRNLATKYETQNGYDGFADYIDGLKHAANVIDPSVDERMDERFVQ